MKAQIRLSTAMLITALVGVLVAWYVDRQPKGLASQLVGRWEADAEILIFSRDGQFEFHSTKPDGTLSRVFGMYEVDGDQTVVFIVEGEERGNASQPVTVYEKSKPDRHRVVLAIGSHGRFIILADHSHPPLTDSIQMWPLPLGYYARTSYDAGDSVP